MKRLAVYLIGPVRRTRERKILDWLVRAKQELASDFECLNFERLDEKSDWAPREIEYVKRCDIVLANMWKPSIGTTLGIVRARQAGRPVVLRCVAKTVSPMLRSLVGESNLVDSMPGAYERTRVIAKTFGRVSWREGDKEYPLLRSGQVARRVAALARAAQTADFGLEAIICEAVMDRLAPQAVSEPLRIEAAELEQALDGALRDLKMKLSSRAALLERVGRVHALLAAAGGNRARDLDPPGAGRTALADKSTLDRREAQGGSVAPSGLDARALKRASGAIRGNTASLLAQAIHLLLPNIILVRQSADTLSRLLPAHRTTLEVIRALGARDSRVSSKGLKGTEWQEVRGRGGENGDERVYFHKGERETLVLVSTKNDQASDKKWAARPANWEHLLK